MTTSIYKEPAHVRVALRTLNLDGDRQSDLTVHGGKHKAVYCYPIESYGYWQTELSDRSLPYGSFGENFSVGGLIQEGLAGESIHVGDRFSVGSAEVVVTQPRLLCYKLGIRFGSDDMVKRFLKSRRTGFYLAVIREGEVGAGDDLTLLSHAPDSVPISEITRLYLAKEYGFEDARQVRRAIRRLELGASVAEVARACEFNANVLHRWRRELREFGAKAFAFGAWLPASGQVRSATDSKNYAGGCAATGRMSFLEASAIFPSDGEKTNRE